MTDLLTALATGFGLALVIEGLVIMMLPRRLDAMVRAFAEISFAARRRAGLVLVGAGVAVVWLVRTIAG
jgi:uncharacterized protein YjeT (DUF2065 family)